MKNKLTLILLILAIFSIGVAQSIDPAMDFLNKFSTCSKSHTDNGRKITVIMGIMNRECHYTEITAQKTVTCTFDKNQISEIARELRIKKHIGISELESGKKYFADRTVCKKKNNLFFSDGSEEEQEEYSENEE